MNTDDGQDAGGEVGRLAAAREEHARLVVARSGDPAFVQRRFTAGGVRVLSWDPGTAVGERLSGVFAGQREAFRARFGREAGPDDPVFFDPDADEPVPLTPAARDGMWDELATVMEAEGIDPAYTLAAKDVGYMITPANRHLYTAHQVEAYLDAVQERWDQTAMDAVDLAELEADVPRLLRVGLARLVADPSAAVAQAGIDAVFEAVEATGCSLPGFGRVSARMLDVLTAWIEVARTRGVDDAQVRVWLSGRLDEPQADAVWAQWQVLAVGDGGVGEVLPSQGVGLLAGLMLIVAALVAGPGQGRVEWIESLDPA